MAVRTYMTDYLFNQNLLIIIAAAATLLGLFYFQIVRSRMTSGRLKSCAKIFLLSVIFLVIEIVVVRHFFTLGNIPSAGYVISEILNVVIASLIFNGKKDKKGFFVGLATALVVLLLLIGITNSFYRYYPTIGSLFGNTYNAFYRRTARISITNGAKAPVYVSLEKQLNPELTLKGTIYDVPIPGSHSGFKARDALVYLPAAYDFSASKARFPVLVLLTGVPGSPVDWLRGEHFKQTMDNFAQRHNGIAPVVVISDHNSNFSNDTECVDSARGNVEQYLSVDVPAYITSHFAVSTSPNNWGIGGLSEGGMCAAMLSLRHQDVYRHFLDMSGDPYPTLSSSSQSLSVLFRGSTKSQHEHNIDWLLVHTPIAKPISGQFVIGGDDKPKLIASLRSSYTLAVKRGITASFDIIPAEGHNARAWGRAYEEALPKLSSLLGATNCEADCSR